MLGGRRAHARVCSWSCMHTHPCAAPPAPCRAALLYASLALAARSPPTFCPSDRASTYRCSSGQGACAPAHASVLPHPRTPLGTAAHLLPQPARVHVLLQQRAGPVLGVPQALVQHVHDGQARVQPCSERLGWRGRVWADTSGATHPSPGRARRPADADCSSALRWTVCWHSNPVAPLRTHDAAAPDPQLPPACHPPMKSARRSGPIGWLVPSRMPLSMSSALPTPCRRARVGAGWRRGVLSMGWRRGVSSMVCGGSACGATDRAANGWHGGCPACGHTSRRPITRDRPRQLKGVRAHAHPHRAGETS